ncbi:hypothetical protein DER44DRAFT_743663 [Fusarium oxysporum]|nr:hypothetical protein DER44DRAFT_743663 [Fusarium oxysporum]
MSLHYLVGQGPFHARINPTQPAENKSQKPGNEQGNDAAPEYHAETFPPGTAPAENTFHPFPDSNYTTSHGSSSKPVREMSGLPRNKSPKTYTHSSKMVWE